MQVPIRFHYSDKCQNKEKKKLFARKMRKNPTPAEALLWEHTKGKKLGVRTHRQAVILGYIADFYIPKARLIIECDGRMHDKAYDAIRDAALTKHSFKVLRFTNDEVLSNISGALDIIKVDVATRHFTPFMP